LFRKDKVHKLETILLIAREPDATEGLRSILESQGYSVLLTKTSRIACDIAIYHAGEIELLIVDKASAESDVADAADGFIRVRPATKILEILAATPSSIQQQLVSSVLPRPFTREGALFAVRRALGEPHPTEAGSE
jgi:DNA-binding NtrC family response regulator